MNGAMNANNAPMAWSHGHIPIRAEETCMRKSSIIAAASTLASLIFSTAHLSAAELRVLAGGGIAPALNELKTQFERASGHTLVIVYATTPELIKEATSGTPFDFGVVPTDVMKDTGARARFAPEPTTDVARVGYGVVVRSGAPKPDLGTTQAFKRAIHAPAGVHPAWAAVIELARDMDAVTFVASFDSLLKALPHSTEARV